MKIVVTGSGGRLGRTVVSELRASHEVIGVDVGGAVGSVRLDLMDLDATTRLLEAERPEAVVHLAAIAVPFSAPESRILDINITLSAHVLEAAERAGVTRVIAASSPTVYGYGREGWLPTALPLDEREPVQPWHAYALSKVCVEELVATTARARPGMRTATFRPAYVIAPEEWLGAPTQQGHTLVERLRDPALAAVSLFNYVDARDVASFLDAWLESSAGDSPSGARYVVAAPDALGVRPTAELVHEHLPALRALTAGLAGWRSLFDSSAAERDLGWRATRTWRRELPPDALLELGLEPADLVR